jgi:hypothetical protein
MLEDHPGGDHLVDARSGNELPEAPGDRVRVAHDRALKHPHRVTALGRAPVLLDVVDWRRQG